VSRRCCGREKNNGIEEERILRERRRAGDRWGEGEFSVNGKEEGKKEVKGGCNGREEGRKEVERGRKSHWGECLEMHMNWRNEDCVGTR